MKAKQWIWDTLKLTGRVYVGLLMYGVVIAIIAAIFRGFAN